MKNGLLFLALVLLPVYICAQTVYYKSDSAPAATMTVVPTGIILQLEGEQPVAFSPRGMNNQFMFYSCGNANATFTLDLQSMVISINGQNYQYTCSGTTGNTVNLPFNSGYSSPDRDSSNKAYYQTEIEQLEYKIRDAERSLEFYKESNAKNPTISGGLLISEQQKLIRTYQNRISWLRSQL